MKHAAFCLLPTFSSDSVRAIAWVARHCSLHQVIPRALFSILDFPPTLQRQNWPPIPASSPFTQPFAPFSSTVEAPCFGEDVARNSESHGVGVKWWRKTLSSLWYSLEASFLRADKRERLLFDLKEFCWNDWGNDLGGPSSYRIFHQMNLWQNLSSIASFESLKDCDESFH